MECNIVSRLEQSQLPQSGGKTIADVTIESSESTTDRPVFIVFCIDSSSSMNFGNRLQMVKDGVQKAIQPLSDDDWIAFVEFADEASTTVDPSTVSQISQLTADLDSVVGHGNTNMIDGLSRSREMLDRMVENADNSGEAIKTIALLTDGAPSEYTWDAFPELEGKDAYKSDGEIRDVELHGEAASALNDDGITVHAAGVGGYSLEVIETIVSNSGGEWAHLGSKKEINQFFTDLINDVKKTTLSNPIVELTPRNGSNIENVIQQVPQVARPKVERHGKRVVVFMPDVKAQKAPRLSFDLEVPEMTCGVKNLVDIEVTAGESSVSSSLEAKIVPASIRDEGTDNIHIKENHQTATGIEENKDGMSKEEAAKEVETFVRSEE